MLEFEKTNGFLRGYKKSKKQNLNLGKLPEALSYLLSQKPLPPEYLDHKLDGNMKGYRDCHLAFDVVFIYKIDIKNNKVIGINIGKHRDVFR